MAKFVLNDTSKPQEETGPKGLGSAVLRDNVVWFVKVRWIIVATLAVFAVVSRILPDWITSLGIMPPRIWPWLLVSGIALSNVCFWLFSRKLDNETPHRIVETNMWIQIMTDLIAVTILVHLVGSTTSFIPFIYLLHIVCACIFFRPRKSFLVFLISSLLYAFAVVLEHEGIWNGNSLLTNSALPTDHHPWLGPLFAASAIAIWFIVWYLVETLASVVVERDRELLKANQQLRKADEEKNKLVLRTTHDLKAPFSGIESNIQVLKLTCGDELSEKAKEILARIERRSHSLADRIRDILLLGKIRSTDAPIVEMELINVPNIIKEVIAELEDKAKERHISITTQLIPLELLGNARLYHILFLNLISNAINYSHDGGKVEVRMYNTKSDTHVTVADQGIGIDEEALPHIFDEFYRTADAASHNAKSTGLGLSIVQEIAHKEGLEISVTSEKGQGTEFDIAVPGDYCSFRKKNV